MFVQSFFPLRFLKKKHDIPSMFFAASCTPEVPQTLVFTMRNAISHLSKKTSFYRPFWVPKVDLEPPKQKRPFFAHYICPSSTQTCELKTWKHQIRAVYARLAGGRHRYRCLAFALFLCFVFKRVVWDPFWRFWTLLGGSESRRNRPTPSKMVLSPS